MSVGPFEAFRRGLLETSLLSLVVAGAVALSAVIGAGLTVTEARMAGPDAAYFAQGEEDDYAFATIEALRLRRAPPVGPHVALIGTAAMREALTPGPDISTRLAAGLDGAGIPVIDFMSGGQSGLEMAALAESLGPDFDGVLVLGISFSRLSADASELAGLVKEPRLAFASPALDTEIRQAGFAPPAHTGLYLLDNYKFFVARARSTLRNLLLGQAPSHKVRTYLGRPPADEAQWAGDAARLKERVAQYDARAEANLQSVARLIRMFPNRNKVKIVLMEIPLNPRAQDRILGTEFVRRHRARMADFAARQGVLYWDLNASAGLTPADFQDWAHINSAEAQKRWTADLVGRLVPLLSEAQRTKWKES